MPMYRGALVELRRVHRDAEWVVTGVVVGGTWYAASRGVRPASRRQLEAHLVSIDELPSFIAPDDRAAVNTALRLVLDAGYRLPSRPQEVTRGPKTYRLAVPV